MHGLVIYLFAITLFPRGPWQLACGLSWFVCGGVSCFSLFLVLCLFLGFLFFFF